MTDQIPADKVREILDEWERIKEYADWDDIDNLVKDIRDLLPPPPRPTLADMTDDERDECQWMQADLKDAAIRVVIVNPCWEDGTARVMWPGGFIEEADWERVTPRPNLPRMEWPDTGQEAADATD